MKREPCSARQANQNILTGLIFSPAVLAPDLAKAVIDGYLMGRR
jgi:hypothetical protein